MSRETISALSNDRKVKVFRNKEWHNCEGLHQVKEGERFRLFEPSGDLVIDAVASRDGFTNGEGVHSIEYLDLNAAAAKR